MELSAQHMRRGLLHAPRWLLIVEYATLFVVLPLAYVLDILPVPVLPALWVITLFCLTILLSDRGFDRRRLWNPRNLKRRTVYALLPFVLAAPLLVVMTLLLFPERLFWLVSERPLLWVMIMIAYPLLSVYPQGIVFRAFIFHRYRRLFPGRWGMILASAIAFSAVHMVFQNWIAPTLTLLGGVLFAWTYDRTRSALVPAVQHAAFGCFAFTVGLGKFFFESGL